MGGTRSRTRTSRTDAGTTASRGVAAAALTLTVLAPVLVGGCGQKGPLVLPGEEQAPAAQTTQPQTQPAPQERENEENEEDDSEDE